MLCMWTRESCTPPPAAPQLAGPFRRRMVRHRRRLASPRRRRSHPRGPDGELSLGLASPYPGGLSRELQQLPQAEFDGGLLGASTPFAVTTAIVAVDDRRRLETSDGDSGRSPPRASQHSSHDEAMTSIRFRPSPTADCSQPHRRRLRRRRRHPPPSHSRLEVTTQIQLNHGSMALGLASASELTAELGTSVLSVATVTSEVRQSSGRRPRSLPCRHCSPIRRLYRRRRPRRRRHPVGILEFFCRPDPCALCAP